MITKWVLKWTFTDGRGHQLRERTLEVDELDDPQTAYRRKIEANKYLVSGATITNVRLYRVDIEETWTQVQPDPPSIYQD